MTETAENPSDQRVKALEAKFHQEMHNTKARVNQNIDQVQAQVTSYKPTPSDPNFVTKNEQYARLLEEATSGLAALVRWIANIFQKLAEFVKQIISWIPSALEGVGPAIRNFFVSIWNFFF